MAKEANMLADRVNQDSIDVVNRAYGWQNHAGFADIGRNPAR